MPNIKNMTYRGHNWIRTSQADGTITMSFKGVSLLTDTEYKKCKKDFDANPHPYRIYRRLKETDRELVEFKFGVESPEVQKI